MGDQVYNEEDMYDVPTAAIILGLDDSSVTRHARLGDFPGAFVPYKSRKIGWRIPISGLLAFARKQGDWCVARVVRKTAEEGGPKPEPLRLERAS